MIPRRGRVVDKTDYILRSLALQRKRWENLLIGRIFHTLDDLDIEFVCQQYVRGGNTKRNFTDVFFPQFGTHLEIDEPPHENDKNKQLDVIRENDIIDASGHEIMRIKVIDQNVSGGTSYLPLRKLLDAADKFADDIAAKRKLQELAGTFQPWAFDERYKAGKWQKLGYLDIKDGPAFRTHKDALECFGYNGGHYQRGTWRINDNSARTVWFPKLYDNKQWDNSLSKDGRIISMKPKNEWARQLIKDTYGSMITFAHGKDFLGRTLYRFIGVFENASQKNKDGAVIFERTEKSVRLG